MAQTVLILGASGRFGRNVAGAFRKAGWTVRAFRRGGDLSAEAQGADVIVNGWNPPYPDWARQVPGLTRQAIDAARAAGATVILPGNVYVFGADAPAIFGPDTPHRAQNPLGRVRIALEDAYRASDVPTIILRAGDFLDTQPKGNWFDRVIAANAAGGVLSYPGNPDIDHAWAFLPDMAAAVVGLAEMRGQLDRFTDLAFPGYTLSGRDLARHAGAALGRPVQLRRMSWLPLQLARPVWPMARCLLEMRYLWDKPHRMDGAAFDALLPGFTATPVEAAMASALDHQIDPDKPVA